MNAPHAPELAAVGKVHAAAAALAFVQRGHPLGNDETSAAPAVRVGIAGPGKDAQQRLGLQWQAEQAQ